MDKPPAPILVLGVGNCLLGDDGIGVRLVEKCSRVRAVRDKRVEFLEGGTLGLALLSEIAGRQSLILLDAVALGDEPGKIHVLRDRQVLELGSRSTTAHEGNIGELLNTARILGDLPGNILLIGIEPASVQTGLELSPPVQLALPSAMKITLDAIGDALVRADNPPRSSQAANQ